MRRKTRRGCGRIKDTQAFVNPCRGQISAAQKKQLHRMTLYQIYGEQFKAENKTMSGKGSSLKDMLTSAETALKSGDTERSISTYARILAQMPNHSAQPIFLLGTPRSLP